MTHYWITAPSFWSWPYFFNIIFYWEPRASVSRFAPFTPTGGTELVKIAFIVVVLLLDVAVILIMKKKKRRCFCLIRSYANIESFTYIGWWCFSFLTYENFLFFGWRENETQLEVEVEVKGRLEIGEQIIKVCAKIASSKNIMLSSIFFRFALSVK